MFDVQKIQTGLVEAVGIRQPLNPDLPVLDASILTSESGLWLNDVAGFDLATFKNTNEYFAADDAQFNELLQQTRESAITDLMYRVFSKPSYIDRNLLFTQTASRTNLETGVPAGFAGYRIRISDQKNVAFEITRTRLEYRAGAGVNPVQVTLYLFNSFAVNPLFSQQVDITSEDMVVDLNWKVDATASDYKGDYYFGLLLGQVDVPTGEIVVTPFKRDYENADLKNVFTALCIETISVPGYIGNVCFDPNLVETIDGTSVGINPDITVFYDYTDLILQNKLLFYRALQLTWAIKLMQICATSMRSNRDERRGKEIVNMIMLYVNGQKGEGLQYVKGHSQTLQYEIENLQAQLIGIKEGYDNDYGIEVITQI